MVRVDELDEQNRWHVGAKPGGGKTVLRISLKTPTLRETLMAPVQAAVDISEQTPLEYLLDVINDDSHPPEFRLGG